jgi:hypothetical protein
MDNKDAPMTYKEAVKYMKKHGVLTIADRLNLESKTDYDSPMSIDREYVQAEAIINEHKSTKFINMKFIRPSK